METQSQLTKFDPIRADIVLANQAVQAIKVTDDDSKNKMMEAMKNLKTFTKAVEETRVIIVKPHNDFVKNVNDYAKKLVSEAEAGDKHGRSELIGYERKLEAIRQEELKKAQEALRKAEAEAAEKLKEQQEEAATMAMFLDKKESKKSEIIAEAEADRAKVEAANIHEAAQKEIAANKVSNIRRPWVFEITDVSCIPRAYLCVDEKAIRAAIKEGVREIEGVRIYQDMTIAI